MAAASTSTDVFSKPAVTSAVRRAFTFRCFIALRAAVGFALVPPTEPKLKLLHHWLDCWRGVGDVWPSGLRLTGSRWAAGGRRCCARWCAGTLAEL